MAAYAIIQFNVNDADRFEAYKQVAGPTVKAYGGRLLARTGNATFLEQQTRLPEGLVLLEFDSSDQIKKWYSSEEYQATIPLRAGAATMSIVVAPSE